MSHAPIVSGLPFQALNILRVEILQAMITCVHITFTQQYLARARTNDQKTGIADSESSVGLASNRSSFLLCERLGL